MDFIGRLNHKFECKWHTC